MSNLFDLLIEFSGNELSKETVEQNSVEIVTLALPREVPFRLGQGGIVIRWDQPATFSVRDHIPRSAHGGEQNG